MPVNPPEDLEQPLRQLRDRIAPPLEEARERMVAWNQAATTFIRKNPGTALLGAVAIGYLVGKLASRR